MAALASQYTNTLKGRQPELSAVLLEIPPSVSLVLLYLGSYGNSVSGQIWKLQNPFPITSLNDFYFSITSP